MKLRNAALAVSMFSCAGLVLAAVAQKKGILSQPNSGETSVKAKREPDGGELIRRRMAWFHNQRAYPLAHIPAFARVQAWQVYRQMQLRQLQSGAQRFGAAMSGAAADPPALWTSIGPQPTNNFFFQPFVSGRVNAMVVDPQDASGNTVFLGGAQGGLWVTTNGGANWAPAADQTLLPSLAIGSLAIDASVTPPILYVGTGEENFAFDSYYGAGILKCQTTGPLTAFVCTPDQTIGSFHAPGSPLNAAEGGPFIGSLAVNPADTSVLLAAVQGSGATLPSGIWCSKDAGVTWTHVLPSVLRVVGTSVAFDSTVGSPSFGFAYVALGTIDGNAGTGQTTVNGVYKSSAALTGANPCGVTFSQLTLPVPSSSMGRIALGAGPPALSQTNGEVFAAIATAADISSKLLGVFKSVDGGGTWTQLSGPLVTTSGGFCNDQCFYDLTVAVDPKNPNVVFAGGAAPNGTSGATLVESIDGGATWNDVSNNANSNAGLHVDLHTIAFRPDGSAVFVGTDGGAWSAVSPANPPFIFNNLNATLALTQFYPGMSLDPSGWQFLSVGGAQDNGTQTYSGTPAWNDTLSCGDGGGTAIDSQTPSTVYGECAYIPSFLLGIFKSVFNGAADNTQGTTSFFLAINGIDPSDPGNFIPPLAIDPTNAQNLYFGTNRVWQSQDGAATWHAQSPDVTGATSSSGCGVSVDCVLTSIAVATNNPNEIVTGSSIGHVAATVNGGQTWTDVTGAPLPPRSITHVAIDPHNANALYATFSGFSGFNGDNAGHVFQGALTPGTTPVVVWTDISNGVACLPPSAALPNIPVNDLAVDPDVAGMLYAATDLGVIQGALQPAGAGACWQPLGAGLPNVAVLSLKLHEASRTLVAGTHGRSAWALQLGGLAAFSLGGLSPASQNAGASAFTLTLTGTGFTSGSTVNWTPSGGSTTSLTQLAATASCPLPTCIAVSVPAGLVASGGKVSLAVFDSTHSPNTTNALTFTTLSSTPTLATVSPASATAPLSADLAIAVTGTNFVQNSTTVSLTQLNPLPSNCISTAVTSPTALTATVSHTQAGCLQIGGTFFVVANNPQPGGGSSNPNLQAAPAPVGGGCATANPPGCLLAVTGAAPPNDAFANATSITTTTFTGTEDTSGATPDGPTPPCVSGDSPAPANNGTAKSVWFKFTPTTNVTAEADTINSNYDTILSVWTGSSVTSLTNVGCNDDIVSGVDRVSQIQNISMAANTTYYFLVTAFGIPVLNASGNFVSQLADGGKLVFNMTTQTVPSVAFTAAAGAVSPSTIVAGSTASFMVTFTPQPNTTSGSISLQPCTSSPSTTTITCSYSPATIPLSSSSGAANATVTIQTTANAAVPPRGGPFEAPPLPWVVGWLATILLLAFLALRRSLARRPVTALALAVLVSGLLIFQGACGGGSSRPAPSGGTPPGSYTITVPTSPSAANGAITAAVTVR
ncbi:MAG TPA: sialidase family protein [Candidatus Acidoferrales bacterium]|nr:sialidase family protein [Candidatus Acidoferrales bacterium]